jgi:aryl-alcohol dehydrogenase-like predicted oxidoreductase
LRRNKNALDFDRFIWGFHHMRFNELGRTGIKVSEICLGTMTWGSQNTEAEAFEQMDYAIAQGVNFLDTAELYPTTPLSETTQGDTERFIGNWMKARGNRDKVVVATKIAGPGRSYIRGGRPMNRKEIETALDASLTNLKTDYVDLYQLHWPNRGHYHFRQLWTYRPEKQPSRAEILDNKLDILQALGDAVKAGKIRAVGLSNETTWGTMQFLDLAEKHGLPRMASVQNEYNLLYRPHDADFAEVSHHEGVGLLAYSPLAAGLLSGKYLDGAKPTGSRGTVNADLGGRMNHHQEPAVREHIEVARKHGLDPSQMALAYCLTRPFMTSVIIGATTMQQLATNIAAKDLELDATILRDIRNVIRRHPMPI